MIIEFDFNRRISPHAVAVALGIDPEGAKNIIDRDSQTISWEFPEVEELSPGQSSALRYISEAILSGTEKQAGWLDILLANTDPIQARREAIVGLLSGSSDLPIASVIRLVAYMATESVNYTRANPLTSPQVSFEEVVLGAIALVQQGAADGL